MRCGFSSLHCANGGCDPSPLFLTPFTSCSAGWGNWPWGPIRRIGRIDRKKRLIRFAHTSPGSDRAQPERFSRRWGDVSREACLTRSMVRQSGLAVCRTLRGRIPRRTVVPGARNARVGIVMGRVMVVRSRRGAYFGFFGTSLPFLCLAHAPNPFAVVGQDGGGAPQALGDGVDRGGQFPLVGPALGEAGAQIFGPSIALPGRRPLQ